MECREIDKRLDALIDSELSPADRLEVESHIRGCPDCSKRTDVAVRIKRIVEREARPPAAPPELRARVVELLRGEPTTLPEPPEGAGAGGRPVRPRFTAWNLGLAAAALVVATLSFFLLPLGPAPKLNHYAAAEGCRDAFLRCLVPGWPPEAAIGTLDPHELRRAVKATLGVDIDEVPSVSQSEFLGWKRETIGGHTAVRMDFQPRPNVALNKLGEHPAAIICVFLLPIESTSFSKSYLEALQSGHACARCVQFQERGTIYCVRRNDIFVAAVSNIESSSFERDFGLR